MPFSREQRADISNTLSPWFLKRPKEVLVTCYEKIYDWAVEFVEEFLDFEDGEIPYGANGTLTSSTEFNYDPDNGVLSVPVVVTDGVNNTAASAGVSYTAALNLNASTVIGSNSVDLGFSYVNDSGPVFLGFPAFSAVLTGSGTPDGINLALLSNPGSFGSGKGVVFLPNAVTVPSGNPSGGGILYVEAGALKYKGSSGTVTTLGNA